MRLNGDFAERIVEGMLYDEHGDFSAGSWIRSPRDSRHAPFTGGDEAVAYIKTGHLP